MRNTKDTDKQYQDINIRDEECSCTEPYPMHIPNNLKVTRTYRCNFETGEYNLIKYSFSGMSFNV